MVRTTLAAKRTVMAARIIPWDPAVTAKLAVLRGRSCTSSKTWQDLAVTTWAIIFPARFPAQTLHLIILGLLPVHTKTTKAINNHISNLHSYQQHMKLPVMAENPQLLLSNKDTSHQTNCIHPHNMVVCVHLHREDSRFSNHIPRSNLDSVTETPRLPDKNMTLILTCSKEVTIGRRHRLPQDKVTIKEI